MFDAEKAGSIFKEHLYDLIKRKFSDIWKDQEMDPKLVMLEFSKKKLQTDEVWRPSSKSAEEQCRPHIMKALAKEKEYLLTQVEFQKRQITVSYSIN